FFFFFFQAEDGIRDFHVTGVQTCALPIFVFLHGTTWASKHWPEADWRDLAERLSAEGWAIRLPWGNPTERERAERIAADLPRVRSEERRVGKECSTQGEPAQQKTRARPEK